MTSPTLLSLLLPLLWLVYTQAQCPTDQCSCSNEPQGLTLYCRDQGLSTVPQFDDTSFQFYEVTLSGNQITSLPNNAFTTQNGEGLVTEVLDLSENTITFIADDAFQGLEDTVTVLKLQVSNVNTFPTTSIRRLTKLRELYLKGFSLSTLPTGALQSLSGLKILSMEECGLQQLDGSDFIDQADSLLEVDLPSNKFTSVPSTGLATLKLMTKLNLARNQITQINTDTFLNMASIEDVNLEQNGINAIQVNAFRGATDTIKRLDLSHNKNGLVESDLVPVKDLYSLEKLDLSHNTLSSLPVNLFQDMGMLHYFSIQNNHFKALTADLFTGLGGSIRELNCMENSINSISDASFSALTGLETLRLDRNPLTGTYSLDTFNGLEDTLTYLSLMDTGFTESHWNALWKLRSLQTLDLEDNQISDVPENTFKSYTSLTLLDLKDNHIEALSQQSLLGLHNSLKTIHLDDNQISTLSKCVFYKFNLDEIRLRNNPLLCDCQVIWLHQWIHTDSPNTNYWKCAAPSQHKGKYLKDIAEVDLTCDVVPPVEKCEEYTTTVTTIQPTEEITILTGPTYPIHLNVTGITASSLHLSWQVYYVQDVTNWHVMCRELESGKETYEQTFATSVRKATISDLSPSTEYFICVTPQGSSSLQQVCINEMTSADVGAVISPTQKTLIILGAVLAVVVVIAIIIAVVCYLHYRNKNAHPKFKEPTMESQSNPELPTVSDQSKRFSKAKAHSLGNLNAASNMEVDRRLDGFSAEERNRILHLFSHSGASTLSMLSTTSQRYTGEPYGKARNGYLNPMQVSQDLGRQDSGEYQEIPADTYDEIPLSQAGGEQDTYNEPYEERPKSTGDILGGANSYI